MDFEDNVDEVLKHFKKEGIDPPSRCELSTTILSLYKKLADNEWSGYINKYGIKDTAINFLLVKKEVHNNSRYPPDENDIWDALLHCDNDMSKAIRYIDSKSTDVELMSGKKLSDHNPMECVGNKDRQERDGENNNLMAAAIQADNDKKMPAQKDSDTKKRKAEDDSDEKEPDNKRSAGSSDKDEDSIVDDVTSFLLKYLINKKTLPTLDQSSEKNQHWSKLSEGLEEIVKLIQEIAANMRSSGDYKGAHFCYGDFNGTDINHGGLFVIGNFPPGELLSHLRGILSTWVKVGHGLYESKDIPPANCSIRTFFQAFAQIMSKEYGVHPDVAMKICLEISYWIDILPITLPAKAADGIDDKADDDKAYDSEGDDFESDDNEEHDSEGDESSADDNDSGGDDGDNSNPDDSEGEDSESDNDSKGDESSDDGDNSNPDDSEAEGNNSSDKALTLYQRTRRKTNSLAKLYIQGLIQNRRPKAILTVGAESFNFLNEMIAEGYDLYGAMIFQHSPNIHPTRQLKFGANKRELPFLYECISMSLEHLAGKQPTRLPMKTYRARAENLFIDRDPDSETGCYIFNGTGVLDAANTLFYARTYVEMMDVIRENGGSIPKSFPSFQDFIDEPTQVFLGLRMEMIWFEKHDYSKKFGVQNETAMTKWVAYANERRIAEIRAKDQGKRITVNQGGAIDEMNNIFG